MPSSLFLTSLYQRMVGVACVQWMWRAASWTAMLMLTVGIAIFAPEAAFVFAISSSSSSSFWRACPGDEFMKIPLDDVPREVLCIPGRMLGRSKFDTPLPTIFAAIMVVGSAFWLQFLCAVEGERG